MGLYLINMELGASNTKNKKNLAENFKFKLITLNDMGELYIEKKPGMFVLDWSCIKKNFPTQTKTKMMRIIKNCHLPKPYTAEDKEAKIREERASKKEKADKK